MADKKSKKQKPYFLVREIKWNPMGYKNGWEWVLIIPSKKKEAALARSARRYRSKDSCERALNVVREVVSDAEVKTKE